MKVKREQAFGLFDVLRDGYTLQQAAARVGMSYSKANGIVTSEKWLQEYDAEIIKLIRKIKYAYEQKSTQTAMHRDSTDPVSSGTHGGDLRL